MRAENSVPRAKILWPEYSVFFFPVFCRSCLISWGRPQQQFSVCFSFSAYELLLIDTGSESLLPSPGLWKMSATFVNPGDSTVLSSGCVYIEGCIRCTGEHTWEQFFPGDKEAGRSVYQPNLTLVKECFPPLL